jgi:hypothetical protein
MMVDVPVVGKVGDRLTSYFPEFGKFEGSISDTKGGQLLMELEMPRPVRRRFAGKLVWLESKHNDPGISDFRQHARTIPANSHSTLTLADGSVHGCFVVDMSAGGAAISAEVQPGVGMPLAVGACVGRVVRVLPDGFAVKFVEPQKAYDVERLLVRPPAPSAQATTNVSLSPDDAIAELTDA